MDSARRPIGEVFVQLGFVSPDDVQAALDLQRATSSLIGEVLVSQGKISRENLASALAEHWGSANTITEFSSNKPAAASGHSDSDAFVTIVGTVTAVVALQLARLADDLREDLSVLDAKLSAVEATNAQLVARLSDLRG
jgi:hypothetical protein